MSINQSKELLKKYFGYDRFRPMQEEIISEALSAADAFVLMPTGGGKSICYQIPGLQLPGTAIVVSPLIALMRDQVQGLRANGVPAAYLNSSLNPQEEAEVYAGLAQRQIKLLYVSPEKLLSQDFYYRLQEWSPSLFAIDEAHCISSWGHDFRPEYTKLAALKQRFPEVPIMALTATADEITRADIIKQLRLQRPKVFMASFDRPNIHLRVVPGRKKMDKILDFLRPRSQQAGIIYCLSRKATESVTAKLQSVGIRSAYYHAGLPAEERNLVQENFLKDRTTVVCATVAFGMGIDKSNVRWVIHYNLPKNMEGYYQEIGRAGRDGLPAQALLFYSIGDVIKLKSFIDEGSGQTEIDLAKLQRMQQFADALICRRKVLLNYFGERLEKDCGKCDVCENPPDVFDGTVIAQKGMSAVARLKQGVGLNMLIQVLRGSKTQDLIAQGLHTIKTYGAGAELSYEAWHFYLLQLINTGLLRIAYEDHQHLQLTQQSQSILFDGEKVRLVHYRSQQEQASAFEKAATPKSKEEFLREELLESLREKRQELADARNVAPYLVFSDATLLAMAEERPVSHAEISQIIGMSRQKLADFGQPFSELILDFVLEKMDEGIKVKGGTYLHTFKLYREGLDLDEIGQARGIHKRTVCNHLAMLYRKGFPINLPALIEEGVLAQVEMAVQATQQEESLKILYEHLEGRVDYDQLALALTYLTAERP